MHFQNLSETLITCIGIQTAAVENLRNSLFNGVLGLRSTGCNATKKRLLTKLLNGVLKLLENF